MIIYIFSSTFSIDVKNFVIVVTISLKLKMHEHIFATNSCNISWTLSNIIIFFVKKKRSRMNDASLINCLKKNVIYVIQFVIFSWKTLEERRLFIFQEYVQVFIEIDEKFQQLKYRQSRFVVSIIASHYSKFKFFVVFNVNSLNIKFVVSTFVVVVTSIILFVIDDLMKLNFVITIVQNKTLFISKMKKNDNKWKLCYYCKLQHSSKIVKKNFNKNFSILISSIWMTTSTSTKMSRYLREKFNFWAKSRSKIYIYLYYFFLFFYFFVIFFFAILQKNFYSIRSRVIRVWLDF